MSGLDEPHTLASTGPVENPHDFLDEILYVLYSKLILPALTNRIKDCWLSHSVKVFILGAVPVTRKETSKSSNVASAKFGEEFSISTD